MIACTCISGPGGVGGGQNVWLEDGGWSKQVVGGRGWAGLTVVGLHWTLLGFAGLCWGLLGCVGVGECAL
jgi:hypothetical protein